MKQLPFATWMIGASVLLLVAGLAWIKRIPSTDMEAAEIQVQESRWEETAASTPRSSAVPRAPAPSKVADSLASAAAAPAADPPPPAEPPAGPRRPAPLPRLTKPATTAEPERTHALTAARAAAVTPTRSGDQPVTAGPTSTHHDVADQPPLIVPFSLLAPSEPATIPAALSVGESNSQFSETEQAEADRLTDSFFQALSGTKENPTDPDYRHQWQQAQEDTDARMRASLGGHAWLHRHREVHREVLRTERSPAPAPAASSAPPAIP